MSGYYMFSLKRWAEGATKELTRPKTFHMCFNYENSLPQIMNQDMFQFQRSITIANNPIAKTYKFKIKH